MNRHINRLTHEPTHQTPGWLRHDPFAALMDWASAWADVREVRLHVLKQNLGAVALYKKWGFEAVETKFDYFVGHPVLRMVKKLSITGEKRKRET